MPVAVALLTGMSSSPLYTAAAFASCDPAIPVTAAAAAAHARKCLSNARANSPETLCDMMLPSKEQVPRKPTASSDSRLQAPHNTDAHRRPAGDDRTKLDCKLCEALMRFGQGHYARASYDVNRK